MRAGRFTLIELLIVIAIIAILASLLLPALKSANDTAKKIVCIGNLSQIQKAQMMYSNDNNEYFWHAGFDNLPLGYDTWAQCLLGGSNIPQEVYLTGKDVLVCPSTVLLGKYRKGTRVYGMYGGNLDTNYASKCPSSGDFMETTGASQIFYRAQRFLVPSSFILHADTEISITGSADIGQPSWAFSPTTKTSSDAAISVLHNGFANCAFVDGHADSLNKKDLRRSNTQIKLVVDHKTKILVPNPL